MKTSRRLLGASLGITSLLFAADFWDKKKFPEWSAKDAQKMLKESPWARPVELSGGGGVGSGGRGGGRGRGGGPSAGGPGAIPDSSVGGGGSDGTESGSLCSSGPTGITATIRWQTSLPIRQALAKLKYGDEAGTSPEAAKMLAPSERFYIISISGVPPRVPGNEATIEIYGKDTLRSVDVKSGREGANNVLYFIFPRNPITLEDKEVEVIFKLGSMNIRRKFRLKDMVYEGNLEL
jgi:hypothetical protein